MQVRGPMRRQSKVTVEAWASFGAQSRDWSRLFSFGNLDAANNVAEQLRLSPRAGGNWVDFNYLGAYANHPQGWDGKPWVPQGSPGRRKVHQSDRCSRLVVTVQLLPLRARLVPGLFAFCRENASEKR